MAVTILEALLNADYNLSSRDLSSRFQLGVDIAKLQVHNATILLGKGYSINDEVEPLLDKFGDVENVPEKE